MTSDTTLLVVAGAHMRGLPLNPALVGFGGEFIAEAMTAPIYRMVAVGGAPVPRPGLIRVREGGASLAVEVWRLPVAGLGALMVTVTAPLGIGSSELDDGQVLPGFICEGYQLDVAPDVTAFGGWRGYVASLA